MGAPFGQTAPLVHTYMTYSLPLRIADSNYVCFSLCWCFASRTHPGKRPDPPLLLPPSVFLGVCFSFSEFPALAFQDGCLPLVLYLLPHTSFCVPLLLWVVPGVVSIFVLFLCLAHSALSPLVLRFTNSPWFPRSHLICFLCSA